MFTNGRDDQGSIPGRVIPETKKMVLYAALLNTQHYKVKIKGKVEQSREWSSTPPTPWYSSYWNGALGSLSTKVANVYIWQWRVEYRQEWCLAHAFYLHHENVVKTFILLKIQWCVSVYCANKNSSRWHFIEPLNLYFLIKLLIDTRWKSYKD